MRSEIANAIRPVASKIVARPIMFCSHESSLPDTYMAAPVLTSASAAHLSRRNPGRRFMNPATARVLTAKTMLMIKPNMPA